MSSPGRNDPCPCGSGRKFKRCCLSSSPPAAPSASASPAKSTASQDRQRIFAQALARHQAGHLAEAETLYRRVISEDAHHTDSLHLLGLIASRTGRHDAAVDLINKALLLSPKEAIFHNSLGHALEMQGRLDEAVDCYERAIAIKPDYPEALTNLGNMLEKQGRLHEAVDCHERALAIQPDYPEILSNLGHALDKSGRLDEAVARFEQALAIRPDYAKALTNLGNALLGQGKLSESMARFEQALAIDPNLPDTLSSLGNALKEDGRLDEAIACHEKALSIRPDYPEVLTNLGAALKEQGRLAEAVASFERALAIDPGLAETLSNLGNALKEQERYGEAIACYEQALAIRPDFPMALSNLGSAFKGQGRLSEAVDCFERAIDLQPDSPDTLSRLGNACVELGRLEQAVACYIQAISLKPDFPECHKNLSNLKTYTHDDAHIPILRRLYETATREADRINACFALAKACEDTGRFDEAFGLYAEGNRLRKAELGYRIDQDRRLFDRARLAFAAATPAPSAALRQDITPILIVGMPRSGTTLVEQILASHSRVFGAGELPTLHTLAGQHLPETIPPDFDTAAASTRISSAYLDALAQVGEGHRYVTDKMPFNFLWLGFLMQTLPDMKIVHMNRDPMAVCWSNFRLCFSTKGLGFTYDLLDLAEYSRMHEALMRFWHQRFPGRIHELNYERLTEHQEEETRRLLDYCGLDWESRCLEFEKTERRVKTASAAQVRHRMYKGSSQAWRRFEAHLAPLIKAL